MRRFVPHLHTFSTLRSARLLHPQYRFIPLHSAGYAPLHSSSMVSVAPYFFSGCSFAQPSGLAPLALCPKSRNAKGCLIFFPRRFTLLSLLSTSSRGKSGATLRSRSRVAVRLPQPRHCAPQQIIISAIATIIIFCGAWGCLIAVSTRTPLKKLNKNICLRKK